MRVLGALRDGGAFRVEQVALYTIEAITFVTSLDFLFLDWLWYSPAMHCVLSEELLDIEMKF